MKGFKRVVSLLMALVMALSLTSAVWADNDENSGGDGGNTGTITLADELEITDNDAKNYVNQYFAYEHFDDGDVLVVKGTDSNGGFYAKQSDKNTAEKAINACTTAIYEKLRDVTVQEGNHTTTFGDRFNSFKEMLGAPLLYPEGGTGEVTKGDKTTFLVADGTYVTAEDVTKAEEYLSKHFNLYYDEKTQKYGVNLKETSIKDDGTFMNSNAAQEAVNDYCNGDLRPRHHVALNQLKIEVSDATGEGKIYFWQLINKYQQMLDDGNDGGGGDDGGNGNGNNNQAPTGTSAPLI